MLRCGGTGHLKKLQSLVRSLRTRRRKQKHTKTYAHSPAEPGSHHTPRCVYVERAMMMLHKHARARTHTHDVQRASYSVRWRNWVECFRLLRCLYEWSLERCMCVCVCSPVHAYTGGCVVVLGKLSLASCCVCDAHSGEALATLNCLGRAWGSNKKKSCQNS